MESKAQEQKQNFNRLMESQLLRIREQAESATSPAEKPTLLLHACCAPCSSAVIERLAEIFSITIYYYNPNIHPQAEYERRRDELAAFVRKFPAAADIQLIVPAYNPEEFFCATNVRQESALQSEPERGERCRRCYRLRLEQAFRYAAQNAFRYFTTTLSISPHKDADKINAIGAQLEQQVEFPTACIRQPNGQDGFPSFLFADFKKKNGYKRSLELSLEYGLYRQDYCGCVFSQKNRPH